MPSSSMPPSPTPPSRSSPSHSSSSDPSSSPELRAWALRCLLDTDPVAKTGEVARMAAAWADGACALDAGAALADSPAIPGRPARPELVSPASVGRRSMATAEGRAMLIHALAHIEFNAVNLALDALWRFPGMPEQYYADWLRVANEEATHYRLLAAHLATLGHAYGDFPGHDSLWEMVHKTRGDITARMALVPRTLEARGLDAVPPMRAKLAQAGDRVAAEILDIILRDEVGHVEIGNRWYRWLCEGQGLEPYGTYDELVEKYRAPVLKGPFNLEARRLAGFTEEEMARFAALSGARTKQ
ncbi:ferritin-like domain-containing protein [Pseudoduganella sp. SL102]|uniref:ferritin-like domain-containing protein n=1 Tax=Pseudoduganella sp. SL102 TaxID=2995154 RepID=UPI00248BD57B|nr:ferritin-like domain-containing protein [Pseudoduganella sp. SL102]WBS00402.1 ferritin-like domain-containing protein [Pseudoduganella sp. SL102]